ncbi:MAG: hypothetical protein UY26_C0003G0305 [Candidatus Jorgensenbacteria bacterium GW2011_GWA1_48_13]|uniref:DUF5666 domain-containing protein n=2 Tax=Candidatus Joergenseniibacteriota TaxID=1752739 RepID=A0A0G1YII8_9BACT|nr:MAG: hypothetical protein UY26_C0003G0305 [Candidatus Jorgensenbacteria bacterium GW2011_GWA1_48_13]KKU99236.1 MAG: hypothetical protein UY32_C0003G0006 [Candidatus Jorgensenbacteria bacterium GW2011_GWC1_48_8]KKW14807.1 MAG: hypothetical protein UY55_C0003G0023 [Candidatus Jorgensenbacteria bacterium GW2011_GWB1_50_10]
MSKSTIVFLIIGLVIGFGIGFWTGKSTVVNEGVVNNATDGVTVTPTNSLSGTIKEKTGSGIIVEIDLDYPPKSREVVVGDDTEITRNGESASLADLQVGDYIFLTADENIAEKQKITATDIYVKVSAE